jgi:opacity protein-like surface antigen
VNRSLAAALLASTAILFSLPARAQGFYWSWAYEPSMPLGDVRNAAGNLSPAGASLGARYLFDRHASLGIGGHWAEFDENHGRSTYAIASGAITGAAHRRVSATSLLAEAHAYLTPDDPIGLYLGLGAGILWMENEVMVSDLTLDRVTRGFAVSPEAGIAIVIDRNTYEPDRKAMQSVIAGIRYTFSTAGSEDIDSTSFLGLTVGVLIY